MMLCLILQKPHIKSNEWNTERCVFMQVNAKVVHRIEVQPIDGNSRISNHSVEH